MDNLWKNPGVQPNIHRCYVEKGVVIPELSTGAKPLQGAFGPARAARPGSSGGRGAPGRVARVIPWCARRDFHARRDSPRRGPGARFARRGRRRGGRRQRGLATGAPPSWCNVRGHSRRAPPARCLRVIPPASAGGARRLGRVRPMSKDGCARHRAAGRWRRAGRTGGDEPPGLEEISGVHLDAYTGSSDPRALPGGEPTPARRPWWWWWWWWRWGGTSAGSDGGGGGGRAPGRARGTGGAPGPERRER